MIYFDNNATTRVLPEVREAMLPYFSESYFNPTSAAGALHDVGKPLRDARESLAGLIDCYPEEIILTSGATESNNWVLQSTARRVTRENGKCHIVVSAIEHPSVLEVVSFLVENLGGVEVDLAPVTSEGIVDLDFFKALIRPDTALISVMLANNETGVIQPVAEAAAIAKRVSPGCLVHTDATQAAGKITVSLQKGLQDVDFLSLSAHKFHGPKGVGALFIRSGTELEPLLFGGGQQGGLRSGTDNPALAAGMAKAADIVQSWLENRKISSHRDALEAGFRELGLTILGATVPRLPNTSLVVLPNVDSDRAVYQLLADGFATSTGSACSSGSDTPSHVVLAMGLDYSAASGVLRISLCHENTSDEISLFLEGVHRVISQVKNQSY